MGSLKNHMTQKEVIQIAKKKNLDKEQIFKLHNEGLSDLEISKIMGCKRGGDLDTHHIKPFKVILDEFLKTEYSGDINNIYNEITRYKDFMNEENMVVLCHDCHTKVHYSDNHELSPYRWESATTIERVAQQK